MKNDIYKVITASGTGTGFYLRDHNCVVTNYHVIQGCKEVALESCDQERHLAKVVMVNPSVDIAVLKAGISTKGEEKIILNPDIQVKEQDKIFIHGYPFGLPYTVTEGIISSAQQMIDQRNYLQTDAAVNPGNSGGPMLNAEGVLLGMTTSKFNNADNVGFGITHTDLHNELQALNCTNDEYHVKCNSCNHLITEKSEFCPNCGGNIPSHAFEEVELSEFALFVESALSDLDISPVLTRAGRDRWEFHQGSALIRIFVFNQEYLFATSPLNKLPNENLAELYTFLLSKSISPYMFGITDNHIYISYRAHISDIFSSHADEIKKNITQLALKADDYDDFFLNKYNCEMAIEGKGE